MIKRIWNFQCLISNSLNINKKKNKLRIVGFIIGSMTYIFASGEIILLLLYLILFFAIWSLNKAMYNNKELYKQIPVSTQFVITNLFLHPLLFTLFFIAIFEVAIIGTIITINIVFGCIILFSGGKINPYNSATIDFEETIGVNSSANMQIKSYIFLFLLIIIIYIVLTTITFIRNSKWRYTFYIIFGILIAILMSVLRYHLSEVSDMSSRILIKYFPLMQNADNILFTMSIIVVFLIPVSIILINILYHGKTLKEKNS